MTDRRLGIAIGALCVLGIGVASYLAYVHYAGLEPLCLASGGCEIVQKSRYAKFAGVPVPVLGLVGYISILGSLLIRGDIGRAVTALLAVFGFMFSMYLTYLELYEIKAICQWCVVSAVLMTLLAIVSVTRLWRYQPPPAATLQS